jgi:hypothetical protein
MTEPRIHQGVRISVEEGGKCNLFASRTSERAKMSGRERRFEPATVLRGTAGSVPRFLQWELD